MFPFSNWSYEYSGDIFFVKKYFFFSIPFYQIYLPKASEFHIFPLFLCYFQTYPSPTGVPGKVNIYSPGLIFAYLNTTLIGHLRINISIMALMILIITLQILTYQKWSLFSFIQYIPSKWSCEHLYVRIYFRGASSINCLYIFLKDWMSKRSPEYFFS